MKLNIWKNQQEIEKTYTAEAYDIMYGTLQDIFEIIEGAKNISDDNAMLNLISENREAIDGLLLDIFPGITKKELRRTKVKELIPVFVETFKFVIATFQKKKN